MPPRAPSPTGVFAANQALAEGERWPTGGVGPEDVVVDAEGRAYAGLEDGRVLRFGPNGGRPETLCETGGRPLGLELDAEGRLLICDAYRGLLRWNADRSLEVLVDRFETQPLRFVNNADVSRDGTIYFTNTSDDFDVAHYRLDLLAHRPQGRLFAYDPAARRTRLLLDGLYFANGVALGPDETSVLVAETGAYRITRLWLSGERKGERETFVDNLPGFPDNLSRFEDTLWVALPSPRNPAMDFLMPRPRLRQLVAWLPAFLQPQPARHGFVLGFDWQGNVTHNLQDTSGQNFMVSGVRQHGPHLYLGSLGHTDLVRVRLPT